MSRPCYEEQLLGTPAGVSHHSPCSCTLTSSGLATMSVVSHTAVMSWHQLPASYSPRSLIRCQRRRALQKEEGAREDYQAVLQLQANNKEAQAGLSSLS